MFHAKIISARKSEIIGGFDKSYIGKLSLQALCGVVARPVIDNDNFDVIVAHRCERAQAYCGVIVTIPVNEHYSDA
jgi:hypothetical protein